MAKFKAIKLDEIKYNPTELSQFWRQYFAQLSLEFGRLFDRYCQQNVSVRYLHRDVLMLNEYLKTTSRSAVIHPFKVKPTGEIGFIYLTGDLCNALIHYYLGGRAQSEKDNIHYLSSFDEKLLSHTLNDMVRLIERNLFSEKEQIKLESFSTFHLDLMEAGIQSKSLLSVQQFLISTGQNTHVIDIAFSNRFLEGRALI